MSISALFAVGSGGFIGAVLRYVVNSIVGKLGNFPLSTLTVNIVGSFIMGLLTATFIHFIANEQLKLFLTTGFLGALTTYSTFAIESFVLFEDKYFFVFGLNLFLNLFGSIIAAAIGYKIIAYVGLKFN